MRILTVGNMYPPHHLGGYELVWQAAVADLRTRGDTVEVLTTSDRHNGVPDGAEPDVHRQLRWYWRDHAWPRHSLPERVRLERHNAAVLKAALERLRPDVVAWWSMGGMSLSLIEQVRRHGLPAVGFVHDDWMLYGPRQDGWHGGPRLFERLTGIPVSVDFGAAAEWVFVSDHTRARSISVQRLPRTSVVHSGIELAFLEQRPARTWSWDLLCVGRLDERKGLDVAVAALALLPKEAKLTIAGGGDGTVATELHAQALELGLGSRVRLMGDVPRAELAALYGAHDAVLFPVRWEEPWGLVPLEAMGIGRPVVATARGGSAEFLQDGANALVVPHDAPEALAAAVRRLAGDEHLRQRLVDGGVRTAAAHTEMTFHAGVRAALDRAAA